MKQYYQRLLMAVTVSILAQPVGALDDQWDVGLGGRVSTARMIEDPADPQADTDLDGIRNDVDLCNDSAPGFPVRKNGCALLSGVLTGVNFKYGTAELLPEAFQQLFYLAEILKKHPLANIHLFAHSDNTGTLQEQARLTRARLRTIGTYLQQQGVSASRLVLRSMAGNTPLYDNSSPAGRSANNRIELLERR